MSYLLVHVHEGLGVIGVWRAGGPNTQAESAYTNSAPKSIQDYGKDIMRAKGEGISWDQWFAQTARKAPGADFFVVTEYNDNYINLSALLLKCQDLYALGKLKETRPEIQDELSVEQTDISDVEAS